MAACRVCTIKCELPIEKTHPFLLILKIQIVIFFFSSTPLQGNPGSRGADGKTVSSDSVLFKHHFLDDIPIY